MRPERLTDALLTLCGRDGGVTLKEVAGIMEGHQRDAVHAEVRSLLYNGRLVLTAGWQLIPPSPLPMPEFQVG